MNIVYKDKDVELKFTYNSFRYLTDFSVSSLEGINNKVFSIITVSRDLLLAAMNCEPSKKYSYNDVDAVLEPYVESGEIIDLFEQLSELLMDSNFFKSLHARA